MDSVCAKKWKKEAIVNVIVEIKNEKKYAYLEPKIIFIVWEIWPLRS